MVFSLKPDPCGGLAEVRNHFCRLHLAVLILAAVALLLGVLSVWLAGKAYAYYGELAVLRLDPMGLQYRFKVTPNPAGSTGAPRVIIFGDSRAEEWPVPAGVAAGQFANRGIEGQTTAQLLARFGPHVAALHPRVVIIQAGINDLKAIPLAEEPRDMITRNCMTNLLLLVNRVTELGGTAVVTTVIPAGKVPLLRRPVWSPAVEAARKEVNTFLKGLARSNVVILDTDSLLADSKGRLRPQYARDFLHLNSAGYAALNKELMARVTQIYGESK
jgi:lysophospholipase L1-like esterase